MIEERSVELAEENLKLRSRLKVADEEVEKAKKQLIEYEAMIMNLKDLLESDENDKKSSNRTIAEKNRERKESN